MATGASAEGKADALFCLFARGGDALSKQGRQQSVATADDPCATQARALQTGQADSLTRDGSTPVTNAVPNRDGHRNRSRSLVRNHRRSAVRGHRNNKDTDRGSSCNAAGRNSGGSDVRVAGNANAHGAGNIFGEPVWCLSLHWQQHVGRLRQCLKGRPVPASHPHQPRALQREEAKPSISSVSP